VARYALVGVAGKRTLRAIAKIPIKEEMITMVRLQVPFESLIEAISSLSWEEKQLLIQKAQEFNSESNFDRLQQGLKIDKIYSYEDYVKLTKVKCEHRELQNNIEEEIIQKIKANITSEKSGKVVLEGYDHPSRKRSSFEVKYQYSGSNTESIKINWREGFRSKESGFNNRMRAALHFLDIECQPTKEHSIYIPEQVTSLYKYLKDKFPYTVGSEYLGKEIPLGEIRGDGIRNEDMTKLSFGDGQFDVILSLDVFEHIPDYKKALAECYRVLNDNGKLLFTVPFNYQKEHKIRAKVNEDGSLTHYFEPEYHGNPIDKKGALCFQVFGWKVLEELRNIGFDEAFAILYWSDYYVYLGNGQLVFLAEKRSTC
jgi:SAM-dependent methyltransferase